ncbi:Acidic fibroblast growth factor intracellular-binding protein [Portunus trituberculatus]|uniref:Acidic fibroblast growth factor intracellular-binding protein n=1 Tax=Portunus trituberculatus TaxID=210409 RepID=A0A5B7DWB1_PORTR|nr:Acidic fibroblast growth factor intracellular-binding protein [Portunus trituberculatus]
MCSEVESNFKTYSRGIINIGCSLNNSRDLRDFFVDAVERVVEPCRQARWKSPELEVFLKVYAEAGSALDIMASSSPVKLRVSGRAPHSLSLSLTHSLKKSFCEKMCQIFLYSETLLPHTTATLQKLKLEWDKFSRADIGSVHGEFSQ